ncbi:MAG: L-asparaginase [Cellvibrionaceae bacterium]
MISIFTTGGTIDKVYFDANSEFHVGDPQVQPILTEAGVIVAFQVNSLLKKDSLDMTDEDRKLVADQVYRCPNQKIIITHGTDGMTATARVLASEGLADKKTVIFVGAMQPARMRYSDAAFNLGFSLAAVQLLGNGIYVAMNGRIFSHDRVIKNLTAGRFEAP